VTVKFNVVMVARCVEMVVRCVEMAARCVEMVVKYNVVMVDKFNAVMVETVVIGAAVIEHVGIVATDLEIGSVEIGADQDTTSIVVIGDSAIVVTYGVGITTHGGLGGYIAILANMQRTNGMQQAKHTGGIVGENA
jgi:hypothetical protein